MKYKVLFAVEYEVEIECESQDLSDEIADIDIPGFFGIRYVEDSFNLSSVCDENGVEVDPLLIRNTIQETEFLLHCNSYGMQKSDLNTTIILRGQPNKIVGLNPRRHKYPIICENQNGTRYVYTASEVNQALLAKKVAAAGG